MSSPIDSVIIKLRVLSRLPEHGRLVTSTSDRFSIDTFHGLWQSTRRWFYQDSRSTMVNSLDKLVNDIIYLSDGLLNSKLLDNKGSDQIAILEKLKELTECIDKSMQGFVNLQTTYSADAQISSEIETIYIKLGVQMRRIRTHMLEYD